MATGTLYTYPDSFRANKILIAAEYSNAKIKVLSKAPEFEFGKTNKSPEFLKKFPLGKVPAFEDSEGNCLYESNAIAYYVADSSLHGSNKLDACLVQQYMCFADNEILPSACAWTFPTLGLRSFNKQEHERAVTNVKKCLELLNNALLTRTFLVGERVTLADIAVCCNLLLLYKQVLDPKTREAYGNVNRWFLTCINQPNFKKVLGEVKLCEKAATFDAKKYEELHPKQQKKGKEESKKQESKKQDKPQPKKEPEPKPEAPVEEKKKDPFGHLPQPKMVFDEWKKMYRNNETFEVALPWLWENLDREGYSMWFTEYLYPEELEKAFMTSNLVSGMLQRLDKLRKNALASILIFGDDGNLSISGVWMFRGQELGFNLCEDWQVDSPYYKFTKLDWDNEEHRKLMGEYLAQEGQFGGKPPIYDAKLFL